MPKHKILTTILGILVAIPQRWSFSLCLFKIRSQLHLWCHIIRNHHHNLNSR